LSYVISIDSLLLTFFVSLVILIIFVKVSYRVNQKLKGVINDTWFLLG